jgi:hypothetical protein
MRALFVELPPFFRLRLEYLDDEAFRQFQELLLADPLAGEVIQGTGDVRKVRFADSRRQKGKGADCASSITSGARAGSFGCSPSMTRMRPPI